MRVTPNRSRWAEAARQPGTDPAKTGFHDGLNGRPSACPWKGAGTFLRQAQYVAGYMDGEAMRAKYGIEKAQE